MLVVLVVGEGPKMSAGQQMTLLLQCTADCAAPQVLFTSIVKAYSCKRHHMGMALPTAKPIKGLTVRKENAHTHKPDEHSLSMLVVSTKNPKLHELLINSRNHTPTH